jgi:DNA-binding SARP family transcriptional activator
MDDLDVKLLGRFAVRRNGLPVPHADVLKVQELLSYLIINRTRAHHREILAETLWGDNRPDQARKYLRQTLWLLQSVLGSSNGDTDQAILVLESHWVQLNMAAIAHVDIVEIDRAFETVRDVRGLDFSPQQAHLVEEAIALYHGDLLEGWYQGWCLFERERLLTVYLILLEKVVDHSMASRKFERGIEHGHKILAIDRARERTHRQLMNLYALTGDRTSALRQYERCATALREELDVDPSPQTVDIANQIRADKISGQTNELTRIRVRKDKGGTSTLANIASDLARIRSELNVVADQLQRGIEADH